MTSHLRVGLVGFGRRGKSLLGLIAKNFPDVTPVAICDSNETNRQEAARQYPDAEITSDFPEMLDTVGIDCLLVETPATYHAALCQEALAKDIYVLSDVPAVATMPEGEELWKAEKASNAWYMLGANPNMWGFVDTAVELVSNSALGKPYYMEAEYIHDLRHLFESTPWRRTYEPIRYCTHSLGPLLQLTDEDLTTVSCFDTGSHVIQEPGQHDAMVALLRSSGNIVVRLLISFINNYPASAHGYRIYATKGYFERKPECKGAGPGQTLYYSVDHHEEKALHELPVGTTPKNTDSGEGGDSHGGADFELLRRFFEAIRSGTPSPVSLREALRMTLPGIVAAQSAQAGGEQMTITYPWTV